LNKRELGSNYELMAAEFLEGRGYVVLQKNFRCRIGEIDIIAKESGTICFIEVKYRKNINYGYPEEAITNYKKATIMKVAGYYLHINGYPQDAAIRFDTVLILNSEIKLIKNAFGGL
jgi:putative endonuclease